MSYNTNANITPFEGSTLAQARAAVINAFSTGDEEFTWNMLCIFYISTAKTEIIDECEKYRLWFEQQLTLLNSKSEHSPQESFGRILKRDTFRQKTNIEFYKKIMLLCSKYGLTEFGKVTARATNVPTI